MAEIQIVVGSVMGTATGVAKTVQAILTDLGHTVALHEQFDKSKFNVDATILVCTASTGMGDLPENIAPFFSFLVNDYPNIANLPYGVISLGDSSYPNFAEAGKTIDEALSDLGAKRLGDIFIMDATEVVDHEEAAATWITEWEKQLTPL